MNAADLFLLISYFLTYGCWNVEGKTVAMDHILEANLKAKERNEYFEGDIKFNRYERYQSDGFDAAVSCPTHRIRCSRLWDGGVIPYVISRDLRREENAEKIVKEAMLEWEAKTCIRFVNRTNEEDFVKFEKLEGCNADVGRKKGMQSISLGDGCLHKSVVVHEIGHVIGFWHEQNRPDRDQYVTVYKDNILEGYSEAFAKFSKYRIDSRGIGYDFVSIMHYGDKAFTKNGRPTIVAKQSGIYRLGNTELSELDIKQTNLVYKCDKINRGWTSWSHWTTCSKTCGGGMQKKTRVCTSLVDGVPKCPGTNIQKRVCNSQKCPEWPAFPRNFSFRDHAVNVENMKCVLIYERADYDEWSHYFFCSEGQRDTEMRWSDGGQILGGWKCTNIFEPREPPTKSWFDNYLCVPKNAPYNFTWSHNGPIPGLGCIQWYAKQGRDGWDDNYLCADVVGQKSKDARPEPIDGNWSDWGPWSLCSKECNGGRRRRYRQCNNPAPRFGGKICKGKYFIESICNLQPCEKCGGFLKGSKGEFTSPNYPRDYPNLQNCTWIIKGDPGKRIILHFESFRFEGSFADHVRCQFDFLTIRQDGPRGKNLGKYCGSKKPSPIASDSNILWINMITDKIDTFAGFRAGWETIDSAPEGCGGTIRGTYGEITSPGFPGKYPHKKTCIWKIEVPDDKAVSFKFSLFDVEPHVFCKYDYLELRDGWNERSPQLGRYCTTRPPYGLKSTQNKVKIKFVTDETTAKTGFKLTWQAADKKHTKIASPRCPVGWKLFPDTLDGPACYVVKNNYFSWYGARDDCLSNSADLVSITSRAEQEFVTKELLKGKFMWLGFTDKDDEGRWAWSDNTTRQTFTNWDGGDPNDGGWLHNEDCALMKPDGKWNDYPCSDQYKYICKRKPFK
ncbi:uncharacterized protein LOC135696579 [Rhopilema esculentum]|uniref:uncharacterized protein LOC135696579 n=1 Tax=Rhopilema esculentum TaxID=499914 RepID=UPI0031D36F08